jgi:hypothetical protein
MACLVREILQSLSEMEDGSTVADLGSSIDQVEHQIQMGSYFDSDLAEIHDCSEQYSAALSIVLRHPLGKGTSRHSDTWIRL